MNRSKFQFSLALAGAIVTAPACDHVALNSGGAATAAATVTASAGAGVGGSAGVGGAGGAKTCAWDSPFGEPQDIAELANIQAEQTKITLLPDERTAYIETRDATNSKGTIFEAHRDSVGKPFGAATLVDLGGAGTGHGNYGPSVAANDLTLYFFTDRTGNDDIFVASRKSNVVVFEPPAAVAAINSPCNDADPYLSQDGSEVWFESDRAPGSSCDRWHLYRSRRLQGGGWDAPSAVVEVSDPNYADLFPVLAVDLLTVYFASNRPPSTLGSIDVWAAHRESAKDGFAKPVPVPGKLNGPGSDMPGWISDDGCRLYLYRSYPNQPRRTYVATR